PSASDKTVKPIGLWSPKLPQNHQRKELAPPQHTTQASARALSRPKCPLPSSQHPKSPIRPLPQPIICNDPRPNPRQATQRTRHLYFGPAFLGVLGALGEKNRSSHRLRHTDPIRRFLQPLQERLRRPLEPL